MHTIASQAVTPAIISLFDFTKPTMPRAFNVLEGTTNGQICVDDSAQPTWAMVHEPVFGTLYLGGQYTPTLLASLIDHLRADGDVGLSFWRDDPLNSMVPANPNYDGATLFFTNRSAGAAPFSLPTLPDRYRLVQRDKQLLAQSFDYESTLAAFGTDEKILRLTHGVMLLDGDTVACEAATGAATHGQIEVGITTATAYRHQGLATFACAKLIDLCEAHGYATWWDCAKQNTASARLARKLGYQNEREYRHVWWRKH